VTGKNGRILFDRPKPAAGCSAKEEEGGGGEEEEEEEEEEEVVVVVVVVVVVNNLESSHSSFCCFDLPVFLIRLPATWCSNLEDRCINLRCSDNLKMCLFSNLHYMYLITENE
jgi:hypothetical protein